MRLSAVLAAVVSAVVLLAAWIASAPPASNPDGVFHLVSIWCAEGTNDVDCVEIPDDPDRVLVPRSVQQSACYAYDPLKPATCAQQFMAAPIDVLAPTTRGNLGGERPQLYYRALHLLKGEDTLTSVTRMRVANAALAILMFTGTSLLAGPGVRRGLHASWVLTSVPLGVWLVSTTNTGAWMIAGAGTAWANALTAMDRDVRAWRRAAAGALGLLGALLALGARTEAAVVLLATLLAILILRMPASRALASRVRSASGARPVIATTILLALLVTGIAMLLPETATISAPIETVRGGLDTLRERGAGNPVLHLFVTVPSLLMGGLGVGWGLGWVDTLVPVPVGGIVLGAWSGVIARSIAGMRPRQAVAVGVLALTALSFPVFTLAYNGLYVGEQYQPRHYVILLFLVMGVAALGGRARGPLVTVGQRRLLVAALTVAHAHLLHQNTRRYVTGLRSEVFFDLSRDAEWWWISYPISPTANWLIGSAAFAFLAWGLSRILTDGAANDDAGAVPTSVPGAARP